MPWASEGKARLGRGSCRWSWLGMLIGPQHPRGHHGLEAHPVGSCFSPAARCQVSTQPAHGINHLQASDVD